MALPAIAPYPMPDATGLPENRANWSVDTARSVLLVHDLQNHFLSAFGNHTSPVDELLANISRLTKHARNRGIPVVYSAQPGGQNPQERGLQQDFWGPGLPDDPQASAIADAVAPEAGDTVLTKWKYSAFVRSDLDTLLERHGRDQLVITGVYAHIGVIATACDAWMRDIEAFVVADAVADFGEREHRSALRWAAGRCAVVTTTNSILTQGE
ncbi:isochorismatase family protein [Streptomyces sp. NPDC056437]|uniref:isochorismatase family protein n=1 Tax=Streptomyces sp. NPDC056437 TaxID=3345816 RepID=UPI0036869694